MNLDQPALIVVDLLPEAKRRFVRIHFLEVTGQPTQAADHIEPIAPDSAWQFLPLTELFLALRASAHGLAAVPSIT